jgi:hypothetical protein
MVWPRGRHLREWEISIDARLAHVQGSKSSREKSGG